MRFAFITQFVILLSYLASHAQSFTTYNYSVPEGLPTSEVYEVYQDRKGFIWFATDNGVVKFDGSRMETFHTKDGLTDPVVFSFFEDHKGRLWFRTFSGQLSFYENGVIKKYKHNDKIAILNINGIFSYLVNEKDELWFTYSSRFGKIDSTGNISISEVTEEGLYYKTVGNKFLLGNSSRKLPGVYAVIIDDKQYQIEPLKGPASRVIRAVKWRNKTYLSVNQAVFEYDGKNLTKFIASPYYVISLSLDSQDNLWVGYLNGGVERFTQPSNTSIWKPEFLKNKSVTKIIQDHEGGYWFSTLENGVFHVPNLLIQHFPLSTSSRIRGVLPLNNKILIGDQSGTLLEVDQQTKKSKSVYVATRPLISLFSNNGNIFISTTAEIQIFDPNLRLKQKHEGLFNNFTYGKNGHIWTFGGLRLRHFDENGNLIRLDTVPIPYRAIHVEDTMMFMADRIGLHIRNKDLKLLHIHKDFADVKISNIVNLNDTTLLITTIGKGFILMNPKNWKLRVFNSQHNFIADHIYSSLISDKILWLGTERGVVKIPINQLFNEQISFEYLTRKSGLISDKVDFIVKANNALWAFSENSFSVIPLSFSMFANKRPLFYIREFWVNNQPRKSASIPDLSHRENNIQITFGFISFNNPNILLRYRLSNNDDWVYTSSKLLLFPSLAPGKYAFNLQYSIDNVRWVSAMDPLIFNITQPWWNKWYTQLIFLFILVILGFFYFRYIRSIYKQKNRYLEIITDHQQKLIQSEITTRERERNRISKELHDRVGTNLTAIKLTVNQLLQNHKEPLTEEVEQQFQIAIREIKDIIYGLTPPGLERYGLFTGLKNYTGKLTKSIPINISLKTFGSDIHRYELNITIFRILQELLSNTVKHSFAQNISIHINSFDDILNIMYEDDGVGFARKPEQSGLGLDNIESRIQSLNGAMKFESGDFGTSYTIDIPITTK